MSSNKASMRYDYYPQPPPEEAWRKKWTKYPIPPVAPDYSGTTIQGKDIVVAYLEDKEPTGFPTYENRFQEHLPPEGVANGLLTAWSPWNNSIKKSYATRVDNEA